VVKQSVPWAGADAPVVFSRWHGHIEQHLAQSGLAYSLLRPSSFMQNFLMSAQQVAERLAAATGRQVRSVDLGPDSYRHALAGAGIQAGWSTAWSRATRCWRPATVRRSPTGGQADRPPPRTFAQFAADHRGGQICSTHWARHSGAGNGWE
jgi:uncharacterized protein YbjT (DUF2867 family)